MPTLEELEDDVPTLDSLEADDRLLALWLDAEDDDDSSSPVM